MGKIFSTAINSNSLNAILLIVRISVSSFMLTHGIPKLMKFFSEGEITFPDPLGVGKIPSLLLTVFSEVVCSLLILIGFGTRLAVIPLMITMCVAAFIVHSTDGFGKQELPLLYLLVYLVLFVSGSGKYSIDGMINRKYMEKESFSSH